MSEHDNQWRVLAIDGIETEAIAIEAIPLLFADATDVIEIEVSDTAALIARLEHEWTRDRALQLLLIVVDSESDHEVRADAVAAADELLRDDFHAHQLVRNLFFSRPMPVNCDLQTSLRIANGVGSQLVEALLSEVAGAQEDIRRIAAWFDGLPVESSEQRRAKEELEKAFETMAPSLVLANDGITIDSVILDLAVQATEKISDFRSAIHELSHVLRARVRKPIPPALVVLHDLVNREKDEILRHIRNGQQDWIDSTNVSDLSDLVVSFARVHMLVSLFDGDPDKWIQFLESHGTAEERASDLPFAEALKRRITEDPISIERLRQTVDGFAALVSDIPSADKRADSRARNPIDNRKSIA